MKNTTETSALSLLANDAGYDPLGWENGSIRNFVLWAIVMKKKGASYGNREGTIGPAVGGA